MPTNFIYHVILVTVIKLSTLHLLFLPWLGLRHNTSTPTSKTTMATLKCSCTPQLCGDYLQLRSAPCVITSTLQKWRQTLWNDVCLPMWQGNNNYKKKKKKKSHMQSSHPTECWVTPGVFSWGRLQQPLTFQWARNHPVESSRRPLAASSWGSWAIWCGTASLTVSPPALPLLPTTTPGWCSHLVTEKLKRKLLPMMVILATRANLVMEK